MNTNLHGKTALVSGSTAGIGFACAAELASLGARVIINGRTAERVEQAAAKIMAAQPTASLERGPADLATSEGVKGIVERFPNVDILVNNLGIFESKQFADITDEDWLRFYETNVLSGIRLTRAYLPYMREKNSGRIVFISSESALQIPNEMIHYGMTKTAQIAISRGVAQTLQKTGVTCNAVLVGPTKSEGVGTFVEQMARDQGIDAAQMEKQFFESARPTSLIQRFLDPTEVANLVAYLCTPAASGTTGAALRVDGGVVVAIP